MMRSLYIYLRLPLGDLCRLEAVRDKVVENFPKDYQYGNNHIF